MIPVVLRPEPKAGDGYDFHHDVYQRGQSAIRQLAGQDPLPGFPKIEARTDAVEKVTPTMLRDHPYWRRAMSALHKAYEGYCAYHARYLEMVDVPTTDHFIALKTSVESDGVDLMMAYTWSNYRLAGNLVNSVKSAVTDVLDPFEIEDGWFALNLGNFETVVGPKAPEERVDAVRTTIDRLHLDRGPIVECRRRAASFYWRNLITLEYLTVEHPFLAGELVRQNRLNPDDTLGGDE